MHLPILRCIWPSIRVTAGFISASDKLKDGAPEAVAGLKKLGVKKVIMLSGDREETAARIAAEAGINEYVAGLLPEDKLAMVESLKASMPDGSSLAFVGDGMNDAPSWPERTWGSPWGAWARTRRWKPPISLSWTTSSRACQTRSGSRPSRAG
jgi:hypothetical protein